MANSGHQGNNEDTWTGTATRKWPRSDWQLCAPHIGLSDRNGFVPKADIIATLYENDHCPMRDGKLAGAKRSSNGVSLGRKRFLTAPPHDWTSNFADSMRYACLPVDAAPQVIDDYTDYEKDWVF